MVSIPCPFAKYTLITLEDIELDILTCGDKSTVDSFREILDVIGFEKYSVDQLDLILSSVEPLLPIAGEFDLIDKDTWPRWATTVSIVRPIFHELFSLLPPESRAGRPISVEDTSLISALCANVSNPLSGFVPLKAILLIGYYRHYLYKKYINTELERAYSNADIGDLKFSITWSARYPSYYKSISEEYLPEWTTSSPTLWRKLFFEKTSSTPTTSEFKFIHTIRQILALELENDVASLSSQREHFLPIQPISLQSQSTASSVSPESQFPNIQNVSPSNASASEASVVSPDDRTDKNDQDEQLFSLREIVKTIRGKNPSAAKKSTVGIFREILEVLSFGNCPVDQLDIALKSVEELLPIATILSPRYSEVWSRWSATILVVRDVLRNSFPSASTDQWQGKVGEYPLISCLVTAIKGKAHSGLLPAKAIVLIRFYAMRMENPHEFSFRGLSYVANPEKNLADTIRKCCTLKWKHLDIAQEYLPIWPGSSTSDWVESFEKKAIVAPTQIQEYGRPRTDKYDFIHTLQDTLSYVAKIRIDFPAPEPVNPVTPLSAHAEESVSRQHVDSLPIPPTSSTPPQHHDSSLVIPPDQERRTTVVTQPTKERYSRSGRKLSAGPSFDLFREHPVRPDTNTVALAPDAIRVVPQQDTAADQPVKLAAVQSLEVRYTNYRSAMDNQRLPWSWDCLNHFEIATLRSALKESANLEYSTSSERLGAFFVWLLLATGQTIKQILQLGLVSSPNNWGSLLFGPIYRRNIHPPPCAWLPNNEQSNLLFGHAEYIDLPLPPPFPALVRELGLIDSSVKLIKQQYSLGEYLKLNEQDADKVVRLFLEPHRTRSMRLLPGKIRNVLGAEIMRFSNDPVATHHLTALPSDMPPSGVYYTSFSNDVLKGIYEEALTRIFGKSA